MLVSGIKKKSRQLCLGFTKKPTEPKMPTKPKELIEEQVTFKEWLQSDPESERYLPRLEEITRTGKAPTSCGLSGDATRNWMAKSPGLMPRVIAVLEKLHPDDNKDNTKMQFKEHYAGIKEVCEENGPLKNGGLGLQHGGILNEKYKAKWAVNHFNHIKTMQWSKEDQKTIDSGKGKFASFLNYATLMQIKEAMGELLYSTK